MEATLSKKSNEVKDAGDTIAVRSEWLQRQLHVAAGNLSKRPSERRGPFEVSDQIIRDLNERFSFKSGT